MTTDPLRARLAQIQARVEKATPGPWWQGPYYLADVESRAGVIRANCWAAPQPVADAEFIAHAREDIPWLLDCVAETERWIDRNTELEKQLAAALVAQGANRYCERHQYPPNLAGDCCPACLFDSAVEASRLRSVLRSIANNACCGGCQEAALVAKAALEMEGYEGQS